MSIKRNMLVTPNIALFIFVGILVISAIIAWTASSYTKYESGKFHTFISILAGLGIFVTFMFYYNIVQLQNEQQQLAAVQEFARISDSVLNSVLDEIRIASTIIPNFVNSITPLTSVLCCNGSSGNSGTSGTSGNFEDNACYSGPDPVNSEACTEKMILSYRIFTLWQDVVYSGTFAHINNLVYISSFLQRANSQSLYAEWQVNKLNFEDKTQQLGVLLFEYGLPITVQTPESYINAATALIADPRYQQIYKK